MTNEEYMRFVDRNLLAAWFFGGGFGFLFAWFLALFGVLP